MKKTITLTKERIEEYEKEINVPYYFKLDEGGDRIDHFVYGVIREGCNEALCIEETDYCIYGLDKKFVIETNTINEEMIDEDYEITEKEFEEKLNEVMETSRRWRNGI